MDCTTIRERHMADEYLAGRLSASETEAYEGHFFVCDTCFADLEFRRQLARQLRQDGPELFSELDPEQFAAQRSARRWLPARRGWWGGGLAAAAVIALIVLTVNVSRERSARYRGLVEPVPYPYLASELRGETDSAAFTQAMAHYTEGRYEEAAAGLSRCVQAGAADGEVFFYLGVARLLAGDASGAAQSLEAAAEAMPASALYRWYRAQALLSDGRGEAAAVELHRLREEGAEYAAAADSLLRDMGLRPASEDRE